MKVQRPKQLAARFDEVDQRIQSLDVQGQAVGREKAVVQQAVEVEGARTVPTHVAIAEYEVHIVHGVNAAEEGSEEMQPARRQIGAPSVSERGIDASRLPRR